MTPFNKIYGAFLARIKEDEWENWMLEEAEEDWRMIMEAAISWFKFPRVSLERDDQNFLNDLGSEEIQIIADYMKVEWLNRSVMTWENIKPAYEERDFSQANLLDKLTDALTTERATAERHESIYYRSRKGKPFDFTKLAGDHGA